MLTPHKIRKLMLTAASAGGRPAYLSAASGLVCVKSHMYVVADDELHLGIFRKDDAAPGTLFRLFDGALPVAAKDRKKAKPDFEALTFFPPFGAYPHGALLACGSGSRPNRCRGALVGVDAHGALEGAPRGVDLACIMTPLTEAFPALNVEGVVVSGDELRIFQRGNSKNSANAMIRFPLPAVLHALCHAPQETVAPRAQDRIDLGRVDGVPLTFTDAAALPNGDMVFSAVAEDTDDAYLDGRCVGAAIGLLGADGALRWVQRLSEPYKIEGLDAQMDGDVMRLLLVTDADDIGIAAHLFSAAVHTGGTPV